MTSRRALVAVLVAVAVVAGCTGSGSPLLANEPAQRPIPTRSVAPSPPPVVDPVPVVLPRDDAPHHRLTEWWYYTGHLSDDAGGRWGFEYVVFRAERGGLPVSWASHLAITDESGNRFAYAQRSEIGPQVDHSTSDTFDFAITGADPALPAGSRPIAWTMAGGNGQDTLHAGANASEVLGTAPGTAFVLNLDINDLRGPVLHDRDGWVDFGPAGGSYYYSRVFSTATGTLEIGGRTLRVDGMAWFDHQWGDFIAVGGGGWDWFAVNLADDTAFTLSLVRDRDGGYPLVYGTFVDGDGRAHHLDRSAFTVDVTKRWRSPASGVDYPAGWRITIPGRHLVIDLTPTVAAQELDTRQSTGVVYWEGSQRVSATRTGIPVAGEAYVELTGYGAAAGG
ncbi:MAG: lipocalin family protein [Chloroflexota bacterium]